LLIKINAPN